MSAVTPNQFHVARLWVSVWLVCRFRPTSTFRSCKSSRCKITDPKFVVKLPRDQLASSAASGLLNPRAKSSPWTPPAGASDRVKFRKSCAFAKLLETATQLLVVISVTPLTWVAPVSRNALPGVPTAPAASAGLKLLKIGCPLAFHVDVMSRPKNGRGTKRFALPRSKSALSVVLRSICHLPVR